MMRGASPSETSPARCTSLELLYNRRASEDVYASWEEDARGKKQDQVHESGEQRERDLGASEEELGAYVRSSSVFTVAHRMS